MLEGHFDNVLDAIRRDQSRVDRMRAMLQEKGKLLGTVECGIQWWVLDGKLYCSRSQTQLDECGDYHEFCAARRRVDGRLPWDPYP